MARTGRPTDDPKTHAFQMRVSESFLKTVDLWRSEQPDHPSRAEAIRRMVSTVSKPSVSTEPSFSEACRQLVQKGLPEFKV